MFPQRKEQILKKFDVTITAVGSMDICAESQEEAIEIAEKILRSPDKNTACITWADISATDAEET